ncbi:MAG: hypothetical protein ACI4SG_00730 [Oligosphaeraceae bacterium]
MAKLTNLKPADNLCAFVLEEQNADRKTVSYYINGNLTMRIAQETETRVYRAPFRSGASLPENPVNPGKLSPLGNAIGQWHCTSRTLSREYGAPLSCTYQETWERYGDAVLEERTNIALYTYSKPGTVITPNVDEVPVTDRA